MPNRWRLLSQGRRVVAVPLMMWADDVSGNNSKKFNKHNIMCASNLSRPRKQLEEEHNIMFLGATKTALPVEMAGGYMTMLDELFSKGGIAFDPSTREELCFFAWPAIFAGDNPLQSELCSHRGPGANALCRICLVYGTQAEKRSEEGFARLFEIGTPRTPKETLQSIDAMLDLSVKCGTTARINKIKTEKGVTDKLAEPVLLALRQTIKTHSKSAQARDELETKLKAQFISMRGAEAKNNVNPHQQTPVEPLHTVDLGMVKYLWSKTCDLLAPNAKKKDDRIPRRPVEGTPMSLVLQRLDGLNREGWGALEFEPDYFCQYRGALNGKHFRALVHSMPFVLWDLITPDLLEAWVTLGLTCPMVYNGEILDKDRNDVRLFY
ncbi:hypothetical protein CALCODRAFT_432368 [Calocera cornea HHB12733]|uniref:Uncharacterized protein n=1 Tax=Calocera cornea HHB12733 TaxID=1353952 RepID=A0A165GWU8_9BASI|nr:hypothetical protein CALCODRAFT_432368 [Calocera cornea HHB12733]